MNSSTEASNVALEDAIADASQGKVEFIKTFFRALIAGPLFVPERYQKQKLSYSPNYPNDFVTIMGIQDGERVVIPAFSNPELIQAWAGEEFTFRKLSGEDLLKIIPEDWWLCINPGQEFDKELSPWEISKLKSGEAAFAEIISEITSEDTATSLEISHLAPEEYPELRQTLIAFAEKEAEINAIYIAKEKENILEDSKMETILIGVELVNVDSKQIEDMRDAVQAIAAPLLIGNAKLKVVSGLSGSQLFLGVFREFTPIHQKAKASFYSLLTRFTTLFK